MCQKEMIRNLNQHYLKNIKKGNDSIIKILKTIFTIFKANVCGFFSLLNNRLWLIKSYLKKNMMVKWLNTKPPLR